MKPMATYVYKLSKSGKEVHIYETSRRLADIRIDVHKGFGETATFVKRIK